MGVACSTKSFQNKTFTFKGERCAGGKLSKERITVLFCCNKNVSDKYPLLCVGNSEKPRCLKNVVTLPTDYKNSIRDAQTQQPV